MNYCLLLTGQKFPHGAYQVLCLGSTVTSNKTVCGFCKDWNRMTSICLIFLCVAC